MTGTYTETGFEIAIIGMSARFPGVGNIHEFWDKLKHGSESITFFSREELAAEGIPREMLDDPNYVKACGVLENKDYFDASFFGYSPREAELMAPQTRLFHECAWTALEDSGYDPFRCNGLIGLYGGANHDYEWEIKTVLSGKVDDFASYTAAYLTNKDFLCTLVSYKLNLVGPSMIVDTACSTSLAAVHTACQAIINGECDMALAGGSAITAHKKRGYLYHEGMILSPDGHCRTFDASAKGTLAGEGVGIVVLKRLTEAVRDRNNIYAVIKGSAANNDGVRKPGFTAPSVEGQAEVIKAAMQMAGVEPQQMGYVETHGTGTQLGDPVEIEALTLAFNIKKKTFCPIGSVKSNFGHLDVAAGIAGLIKTVLSLKNRLIPPSLNFQQPNPKIDFANSPFYVNDKTIQWKNDKYPLVAGVSSFGIGGTNVHVILEQAPELNESVRKESNAREYQLILLSAKTGTALDQMTVNLSAYLKQNPAICLPDMAYTLQQGRKVFRHRRMLVCPTNNLDHAIQALSAKDPGKIHSSEAPEEHPPMIFMFPGQGAQYVDMGLELYQTEPVFARAMDRCFEILKPLMGYDLKEILYPVYRSNRSYTSNKSNKSHINQTEITQPVIFAFEYALAQLLLGWGIKPYAMIGHSIGEYTAACLSGVFSLEDALELVALRGKLMQKVPSGAMLSVPAAEKALIPLLNEELDLAAVNSGSICVVSGTHQAIDDFDNQLRDRGIQSRRLHTSHAFHSKMMDPILTEFENKIKENQIQFNPPRIQYISNVTGDWMIPARVADPGYWSAHLRKTVRFGDGAAELLKQEDAIFVEVGPGTVLSTFVRKHPHKKPSHQMINLLRHPNEKVSDIRCLVEKLGQLWLAGAAIDWRNFYSREERYRLPLPTYPFEGVRFWIDEVKQPKPPTSHKIQDPKNWFYIPTWTPSEPGADSNSNSPGAFPSPIKGLVFMDSIGLGSQLLRQWEINRGNQDIITLVKPGTGFNKVNDREYIINPSQGNDYDALFKELKDTNCIPGIIIYLWTVTGTANNGSPVEEIDQHQQPAFYSLLEIARALGNQAVTANLQLNVITDNMQKVTGDEALCPAKAMVLGPVKVIPREYPNITCGSIDIVPPEPGSREETNLINQLLREFTLEPENRNRYKVVAYRDNHRLVRTYEPYTYNGSPGTKTGPSRLKEGGVYLVTGGLGGIGYTIARHLAETVRCSLVLVGRSSLPARDEWDQWLASREENDPVSLKIENLRQLEKLAGQVLFFSADVSDHDRMQGIFKQVKGELGQINGLFHAAGVADYEGTIQRRSLETTAGVLAPKIKGTAVLDQLVKEENIPLDFFILCSSITTILGSFGEVGYCSANAYLDDFAQYKASQPTNKQGSSRHWTTSVNWDAWQEVGMAVEAVKRSKGTKHEREYRDALNLGILPREGAEVMANITAFPAPLPQVVVSTTNLQNRLRPPQQAPAAETAPTSTALTPAGEAGTAVTLYQRPGLSTAYTAPSDDTGRILARVWQKHLGIEKIGIYDNFFELGADSLDLMKINTRLKEVFEKDIPIVSFYTYPTIEALTGYLEGEGYEIQFSREELRRLRSSLSPDEQGEVKKSKSREVAVIGMAGRFPGAKNLAEYWENLKNGVESISFFGDEELEEEGFPAKMLKEPNYVRAKSYIEDIEYYDASFFGYKPREAEAMDPQIRVFQECVWEALETAGYEPSSHQTIGLYAGGSDSSMWMKRVVSLGAMYSEILLSNKDVLCTQTSYKLDLKGPSFSLQTACSTSLAAVHLACRGLVDHECDMALAGGVSITVPKKSGYLYQEGMIHSPEGHVRAFDAKANGTVFGNGAGVVLLKRLDKAEAHGDTIYAVIKGTAINNDGERKVGFTAPSTKGQAEVIMAALQVADVQPESITYVETHGTGTSVGDPIEIEALKLAFSTDKKQFCGLGSVKSNIGHLDAAAGIASFIKAVLALKHQIIPPSLHFETPNPEIDFDNSPFYVINRLTPWESNTNPKRAGVSSFGVGGTNAHAVLEEWPGVQSADSTVHGEERMDQGVWSQGRGGVSPPGKSREYQLILLSAKTLPALDKMTTNLAEYLKKNPGINLADVAYTLQVGRRTLEYRKSLVCRDVDDAIEALSSPASGMVHRLLKKDRNKAVVFMFPGQGAQYVDMGRGLYETETIFRQEMDRCFEIFKTLNDYDIKEILYPNDSVIEDSQESTSVSNRFNRSNMSNRSYNTHKSHINQTEITQPVIFIFEYALARLLMHWGIKPDAMIGHSIGEFTAACLAGVLSLEDTLKLVAIRGKLMQQMPPGAMLSVQLPEEKLKPLMEEEISLAAVNGPSFCAVSGTHEAVDAFEKKLKEMGHKTTRLHTSHAFHSGMMDPVVEEFKEKAKQVRWDKPKIPYISNVTGQWLTDEQAVSPAYWAAHLRQTVRFSDGITELLKQENTIFLEVGPGQVLTTLARKQAQPPKPADSPKNQWMINLIKHPQEETPDEGYLLNRLGQLWLYGRSIDEKAYYGEQKRYRIPLSTYPFERQRFWAVVENTKDIEDQKQTTSPLERKAVEQWFYIPSWKRSLTTFTPHPGAGENENKTGNRWLIFTDSLGLGTQLGQRLQKEAGEVISVSIGQTFEKQEPGSYTLDPQKDEDYEHLFNELAELNQLPTTILHLWNVTGENGNELLVEKLDNRMETGFYSMIAITRAVGKAGLETGLRFWMVTDGMQEVVGGDVQYPLKAAILGPTRVINREYANIDCRSIDIETLQTDPPRYLVEQLLAEILAPAPESETERMVAFRHKHRWVQTFEPTTLKEPGENIPRLKEKGVYLVTGGLGGIGLVFARHLAARIQARLILTSRSAFPHRDQWEQWLEEHDPIDPMSSKIKELKELEEMGAEILIAAADVTDIEQTQAVITRAKERFGAIDGVIHAAGVPDGALIQLRDREMSGRILAPKIKGTLILDRALQHERLDFFMLCSSIIAIQGQMGQAGYSAANAFMDAFAFYKNRGDSSVLSVNWDGWAQVGMGVTANLPKLEIKKITHPIFERYVTGQSLEDPVVVVGFLNVKKFWFLEEHRVLGNAIVPGTAYLEMARAAFEIHMGRTSVEISRVYYLNPLLVADDENKEFRVVLKKQEQAGAFEFVFITRSPVGDTGWIPHARGEIAPIDIETVTPKTRDIKNLAARHQLTKTITAKETPDPNSGDLLKFGPRWYSFVEAKVSESDESEPQALGLFQLPETYAHDMKSYQLHPALLDYATSFLGSVARIPAKAPHLPFSYKQLRVFKPLPPQFFAYSRLAGTTPGKEDTLTLSYDILIMDEQGNECVEIEGFTLLTVLEEGAVTAQEVRDTYPLPPYISRLSRAEAAAAAAAQPEPEIEDPSRVGGILTSEGIAAFDYVMGNPLELPQIIVSTRDVNASLEQIGIAGSQENLESGSQKSYTGTTQERPELTTVYVPPTNKTEEMVAEVVQDYLGIEKVGINDTFFDLGATSLDLVQLGGKLKTALGKEIPVVDLFRFPTVSLLVKNLASEDRGSQQDLSKQAQEKKRDDGVKKGRQIMQSRRDLIKKG